METASLELFTVPEIELVYKSKVKASEQPKICHSGEAYAVLLKAWDENRIDFVEQFKVVLMNTRNRVLGIVELSSGGMTQTIVDVKNIFAAAIKANAYSIILAHNHPSGECEPSRSDRDLTDKVTMAGRLLGISVFDHIIISSEGYYSMMEEREYKLTRHPSVIPMPF